MIYKTKTCKHCRKEFQNIEGRIFSNHVRWCDKNPNRNDTDNIGRGLRNYYTNKNGKIEHFEVTCHKCQKQFLVEEPSKKFPIKEKYFCSRSCANSKTMSEETKEKLRRFNLGRKTKISVINQCVMCNTSFDASKHPNQKCCSVKCAGKLRSKNTSNKIRSYRSACLFDFNLADYPDEFDFSLIEEHGWYSPTNRRNNLNGVSRDHIVSVKYGFENQIDPKIISHPANCQLMVHTDNISKNSDSDMTVEELLNKIQKWEEKYANLPKL